MIRIRQIKVPVENDTLQELRKKICQKVKSQEKDIISVKISKKSLDARFKPNIF